MRLSLNETHKLVKDAGRGSGLTFGEADELAGAAVWLEVAGLPGLINACRAIDEQLNELTAAVELSTIENMIRLSPRFGGGDGRTGALAAGVSARDLLTAGGSETILEIRSIYLPILAIGLIAPIDPGEGQKISFSIRGTDGSTTSITRTRQHVRIHDVLPETRAAHALVDITISKGADISDEPPANGRVIWSGKIQQHALEQGLLPDPKALKTLRALAHNCLVPATEESRLKGAGAGTVDRD